MNRLKELRNSRGLYQKEVAKILNLTTAAYCQMETGKRGVTTESLEILSRYYGVSVDYLLGHEADLKPYADSEVLKLPIAGIVPIGEPLTKYATIEGYISMPKSECQNCSLENLVAYRVRDDSMSPLINKDDMVIVRTDLQPANGLPVVCRKNGIGDFFIREYKEDGETVMLLPLNPAHRIEYYTKQEFEEDKISIAGIAIEVRRSLYKNQYI